MEFIEQLKKAYSDHPDIVKLLDDIEIAAISDISTKTYVSGYPEGLRTAIMVLILAIDEDDVYISDAKKVIRVQGKTQNLIQKFIEDHKLNGEERYAKVLSGQGVEFGGASEMQITTEQIIEVQRRWGRFLKTKQTIIPETPSTKATVLSCEDPKKRVMYVKYLKTLKEYDKVPESIWDDLADMTVEDIDKFEDAIKLLK